MTKVFNQAVILIVLSFAVSHVYKYYRRKKKEERKVTHEVIMFSHDSTELKKSKYSKRVVTPSMERIMYYLNSAKHSLDICMYVLTNADLANVVLKLHNKGVKIRVIIDADMAFSTGSHSRRLEKYGIPVRWMKSTNLMHHKFCLINVKSDNIDVTPLVMMGSLNWTNQALYGNWEDVVVTSQKELVEQYVFEFERLWTLFSPIV